MIYPHQVVQNTGLGNLVATGRVLTDALVANTVNRLVTILYSADSSAGTGHLENTPAGPTGSSGTDFDEEKVLKSLPDLEPEVLTKVHDRFYNQVYRYAAYRLSDPAMAEDLAAEVFLRLIDAIYRGRGPRTSLRGWLLGTASNLINDFYRRRYKVTYDELSEELAASEPGPAAVLEHHERQLEVRAALGKLTSEQQNVLALRFGAGLTVLETAEAMNKKVNAVKQLQFRAVAALRRYLERELS